MLGWHELVETQHILFYVLHPEIEDLRASCFLACLSVKNLNM